MLSFAADLLDLGGLSTIIERFPTWIVPVHRHSQTNPAERFLASDTSHMLAFILVFNDGKTMDTGSVLWSFVIIFLVSILCIREVEDASPRGIPQEFVQEFALFVSTEFTT